VSTSRFADSENPAPEPKAESLLAAAPAEPVSAPHRTGEPSEITSAGREKFGDRIARLIGTMTPDDQRPAAQEPSPAETAAPYQAAAQPGPSSRHPAEPEQPPFRSDSPDNGRTPGSDPYPRGNHSHNHNHWHPASETSRFADETRPLLDASILISAVWRFRLMICAFTVIGAILGVIFALATPHKYYAESRLFVDPREIRVTDDDIRNQQLSTEAMLAITDSQLQILSSTSVLEEVIGDLGLNRDPEFNGSLSPGGIRGGLSLIKQILTGRDPAEEAEQKALNNLREALSVSRDAKTFVIIVGVRTRDADKSALIANQIVETYLDSEGQAQSNLLERTSESIDTRINSLRSDLDAAEREVERFKAENGLVGVGGQYIDDKVILALSDQLGNARAMKVGIRVKAENLAKVNINDVLSGAFPEELLSANLGALRKQYTETKSSADSLGTRLGPRHPQYIAAMQSLKTITNEISAELRRIVASSQTELQRAVETEQELASQMAVAKSRAMDQSVELVTLRELERKANATRGIYEAFLTRSRETSERSNLSTRNVRVISPAEAPIQPMGPSRKIIAIAGMMAGFFAGLGLALLIGAIDSIRAYNGAQFQNRYPGSPTGGYPQPPQPGPGSPSGGPGAQYRPRRNDDVAARSNAMESAMGDAGAQSHSAARAQAADRPGHDSQVSAEPVRTGFLRPNWVRREGPESRNTAPGDEPRFQPKAAAGTPPAHLAEQRPATRRNAQAFMSAHAQPQPVVPETTPVAGPAPAPVAPSPAAMDPRGFQPSWGAYPAPPPPHAAYQPQPQPQPQQQVQPYLPAHAHGVQQQPLFQPAQQTHQPHNQSSQSGYMVDPYGQVHPAFSPSQPAPHAVPYAAAPVYQQPHMMQPPLMQPPLMQASAMNAPAMQYQTHPAPHQSYQPQHQPMPAQAPYYPEQQSVAAPAAQPYPTQTHAMPEPQQAPQAPAAASLQTAPAAQPVRQEPPSSPASNEQLDRIRREMNQLRSRIDGYGSQRRRA
jgi:uncharacterized protein involved in exopolysaccharide biosynthesis